MHRLLHQQPGHHLGEPRGQPHRLAARQHAVVGGHPLALARLHMGQVVARLPRQRQGLLEGAVEKGDDGSGQAGSLAPEAGPERKATTGTARSEEHTSELQSLMSISYAVFCLTKKKETTTPDN